MLILRALIVILRTFHSQILRIFQHLVKYTMYNNEYQNRQPCKNPLPCMNSELRGAIYRKHMLYSQYTTNRNIKTWEKFRKQRNLVAKLKKNSMKV